MKKLIIILLAGALLLCSALFPAVAEGAEGGVTARPVVDLTGLIIAVLLAVFEFLMARFAAKVIPAVKEWLDAHTTEKERGLLWNAVCELVDAAEQIIKGEAMGEQRMNYVQAGLRQRGLAVDVDMIEAAVRRMKQSTRFTFADAFGVGVNHDDGTMETEETVTKETEVEIDDYPHLPPLEEWPMEMIVAFTRDNGIPHEGCETKEEYIEAIVRAVKEEPESGCATKDYCELDEDGNQIPEEPQSGNE